MRAVGLVLGEIFSFGRHRITQGLLSLGVTDGDWSAWYRLFSRERFDEEKLSECLLQESLEHVGVEEPYCAAIDSTSILRSSLKMPGTSWLRDTRFSAFRPGIHRVQRFLQAAWLTPLTPLTRFEIGKTQRAYTGAQNPHHGQPQLFACFADLALSPLFHNNPDPRASTLCRLKADIHWGGVMLIFKDDASPPRLKLLLVRALCH